MESNIDKEKLYAHDFKFLLENEAVLSDPVMNNLILFGSVAHKNVQDVEISYIEESKTIVYFLFFTSFDMTFVSVKNLKRKLSQIILSELPNHSIEVFKINISKKDGFDPSEYLKTLKKS